MAKLLAPNSFRYFKKFNPDGTINYNLGGGVPTDLVKPDNTTMKVVASEIFTKPNGKKYCRISWENDF